VGAAADGRVAQVVEYSLVITQKGEQGSSDAIVAVRDRRILRIGQPPEFTVDAQNLIAPRCTIVGSGTAPDSVVIRLRLSRGAAMWLGFSLPVWEAVVSDGFTVSGAPAPIGKILDLVVERVDQNAPAVTLDVFAGLWSSTPWLTVKPGDGSRRWPSEHKGRHQFALNEADLGKILRITFPEVVDDAE